MIPSRQAQPRVSWPTALVVLTACVGASASAQQPAPPPVDRAALERQAEINKRPDTPGTGRSLRYEDGRFELHSSGANSFRY